MNIIINLEIYLKLIHKLMLHLNNQKHIKMILIMKLGLNKIWIKNL